MRTPVHFVGPWVESGIARGKFSRQVALPLGWLVSRLPTPPLTIAVAACLSEQLGRNRRGLEVRQLEAP